MTGSLLFKTVLCLISICFFDVRAERFDAEFLSRAFVIPSLEESHYIFGQASSQALDPESIKVFVWNIYKAKKDNYHEDFTRFTLGKDILMLQEALNTPDAMRSKLSKKGFRWDFAVSFGYRLEPGKVTGTMLGSRVAPRRAWMLRTKDYEPVVKTPKAMSLAVYPIRGRKDGLMVVNIHGLNLTGQGPFERQLLMAMNQVKDHRGPVIFAGDFNTRTNARLVFMRQLLSEQSGMKEIFFRNDERTVSFGAGYIIDFVFVRGLDIVDSEVLGFLDSSDHKAMVFEAKIP